jgi:hypothetical protein
MDYVLTGSLEVLRDSGLGDPRLFFVSVTEVHEELDRAGSGSDFDAFRSAFAERASREGFAEAGENFTRFLGDNGGTEVVRKVVDEGADSLAAEYERMAAEPAGDPAAEADDDSYDEDAWGAFVVEYGAGWNGDPETWDAFTTWFLYHAEEQGLRSPAAGFLEYAAGESDRVAFFAQYGIAVEAEAGAEEEAEDGAEGGPAAEADPGAWQAFLAEYGPAWDGAEENWVAFTPYFLHYAEERGVTGAAQTFLENAPDDNAERVGYFAANGITIDAPGTPEADATGSAETEADQGTIDEAQQQFQELAQESTLVPPELEDTLTEAFAQLVAEMPEAAALSAEQMRELLATIPAEHL